MINGRGRKHISSTEQRPASDQTSLSLEVCPAWSPATLRLAELTCFICGLVGQPASSDKR